MLIEIPPFFLTEPAIENIEALKLISLLGLAAVVGPVFIGGLVVFLRQNQKE